MIWTDFPKKVLYKIQSDGFISFFISSTRYISQKSIPTNTQFILLTLLRYQKQKFYYSCIAHPCNPIHINPRDIEYRNYVSSLDRGLGQIRGGNWDDDDECESIESHPTWIGLKQRFEKGYNWEETDYFKNFEKKFKEGKSPYGYENVEEFKKVRCSYVDDLFKTIREDGYQPNFNSSHDVPSKYSRASEKKWQHSLEPLVTIGRDGEIFYRDGIHRLTIANILDIKTIPVNVVVRHKKWQQLRDNIEATNLDKSNHNPQISSNHPDLDDILDN